MGVILDSSVLIALERARISPRSLSERTGEELAVSAVTVSELQFGFYRAVTSAQRTAREAFISSALAVFPVVAFDLEAALVHARLWADLAAEGQQIGVRDAMIAATALAHGHAVMTDNLREFSRVAGLEVRRMNV